MKLRNLFLVLGLLGTSYTASALSKSLAMELNNKSNYTIESNHTYVEYQISHFDTSVQSGKWFATGNLHFDENKIQDSSVNINIQIGNIVSGIPELDKHLTGSGFFDVAKYPTATFVSKKVSKLKKDQFKVDGDLTLHGITKPVTLSVTKNKVGVNPMTKLQTAGFSATTTIKRSDFGLVAYPQALGNEIKLNIQVEAYINKPGN